MRKCSEYLAAYKAGAIQEALTFDDILLVPQYSEVQSRMNADISAEFLGKRISTPFISANMDTVTERKMAETMYVNGGVGILHRYASEVSIMEAISGLKCYPDIKSNSKHVIPSIGVSAEDFQRAINYEKRGATAICIDIAHGNSMHMVKMVRDLRNSIGIPIIAGNVVTKDAALRLVEAGVSALKVGVGPGAMCVTRVVTGHGLPQLHAIAEIADVLRGSKVSIIADGGIRSAGDVVKALAFGADTVMMGSMLSGTEEAPGDIIEVNGKKKKSYRGMASKDAQVDWKGKVNNDTPEGVSTLLDYKGSVVDILNQLKGGLRSGLSYSGVYCIEQLKREAYFVKVTSAGYREGTPHGLNGA